MAAVSAAVPDIYCTEDELRTFLGENNIDETRIWFDKAFEARNDLGEAKDGHDEKAKEIADELAGKQKAIDNSVDVLGSMMATNVQVEEWLNGVKAIKQDFISADNIWGPWVCSSREQEVWATRKHTFEIEFKNGGGDLTEGSI